MIEKLLSRFALDLRTANACGEALGSSGDELAFYGALETNDSAVRVHGDDTLRSITRELVATVCGNVTIDWTLRENVRAYLLRLVQRVLRKHRYLPDGQEKATHAMLEQSEALSAGWAGEESRATPRHTDFGAQGLRSSAPWSRCKAAPTYAPWRRGRDDGS